LFGRVALLIARSAWAGRLVGVVFARMSFLLPVQRLRETQRLVAFYHPKPAHAVHVLIVPKRACASLMELSAADAEFFAELIETVQGLVRELSLEGQGYRLVVNGGAYQEIKQLHFHLIAG
jgi:histidine triad (HIT) family protein